MFVDPTKDTFRIYHTNATFHSQSLHNQEKANYFWNEQATLTICARCLFPGIYVRKIQLWSQRPCFCFCFHFHDCSQSSIVQRRLATVTRFILEIQTTRTRFLESTTNRPWWCKWPVCLALCVCSQTWRWNRQMKIKAVAPGGAYDVVCKSPTGSLSANRQNTQPPTATRSSF